MIIVREPLHIEVIKDKHSNFFKSMVKFVVDIEKNMLAVDAELHADLEALLLEEGSMQKDLWGANLYFHEPYFIEYTSLINIRPPLNKNMEVEDTKVRKKIDEIVRQYITWNS